MDATFRLTATCPEELVPVVAAEVAELGATDVTPSYMAVHFTATPELYYGVHLRLRTASRVLRIVRECAAATGSMLYDQAIRVPWPDLFEASRGFRIEVTGEGRGADAGRKGIARDEVIHRIRDAVLHTFQRHGGGVPAGDPRDAHVTIVAHVHAGRAILALDTAGKALDKRGYREEGHPAPVKETLAAAILRLAGYDGSRPLLDPFCGSGTLAIEGAMLALDKAPLIHRKKGDFGFEWLKDFDRDLWRQVQDRARAARLPALRQPVFASDVDPAFVDLARANALRARVERDITFATARFQDLEAPAPSGLLVANLPYGERLGGGEGLADLYREVGDTLKRRFQGWTAALLAADDAPWKHIGLRPDRRIPLRNGPLAARLLIYEIRPWRPVVAPAE